MAESRYFRAADAAYEQARASIDAALGYPSATTDTIWTPAAAAPHDAGGRCLLALWQELCDIPAVAGGLAGLEEISEDEYRASLPVDPVDE